ncbi:MAG TPA: VWA domain-containing protein, partial [Candidatus Binataceae bacterium]|nr:VWA domain-containing protein [Candidatus Binataceae bacterium]
SLRDVTWLNPQALYLLIGVGVLTLWWIARAGALRKIPARVMRAMVLALLVLAMAGPQRLSTSEGAAKPVVLDASMSITPEMRNWAAGLVRDQLKLKPSDPAIIFAKQPVAQSIGEALDALTSPAGCQGCGPQATDLAAALQKLAALDEANGTVVLITDGWENQGNAAREVATLLAAHTALYIFTPPGAAAIHNVAVSEVTTPHALANTDSFRVGVTLANLNSHPVGGTVRLFESGRLIDQRNMTLNPGSVRVDFPVRSAGTGLTSYRATFTASNPADDLYRQDDSLQSWVGIGAKRRMLIFASGSQDANYLQAVARRLGLEPEVAAPGDTRFNANLHSFDAVVLDNVARERMPAATENALARYVAGGGALAMVGGDRGFGLGGWHGSELETIMPVIMKPPEHKERQRALVLIIDKSGSMGRADKLVYAKAAARTAANSLKDNDLIEVIGFDSQPFVVVPLEAMRTARPYLAQMIDRLKARGTTYLIPALKQADRDLASSGAAIKHVVILTDGETGGTAAMYYDLVATMHRQGGVSVSSIAIGNEANVRLLDALTQYGGGALYQTSSAESLPQIVLQDVGRHTGENKTMVEKEFAPVGVSPDPILKSLGGRALPAIKGYVSTELKPGATLDAYVSREGRREPLIASTRYGAGKTLAMTTDGGGRWASPWVRSNVFSTLWDRILEWMTPPATNVPKFDVAMGYREGRVELKLTDYDIDAQRTLALVSAMVARPDRVREDLVLSQSAPGELTGSFAAPAAGTYYIELKSGQSGKERPFPPLAYTVSPVAFAELPRQRPNYDLLEHLAAATGGRLNPPPGELVMARPQFKHTVGFAPQLLLAAMLLLIAEAVVRRLTS